MTRKPVPRATYRLQLTADFTFDHAEHLVPYLAELGISHAYLSPILKARPGSTHGYDTVDHRLISAELGGEDGFRRLAERLKRHGMGIVLDIVPNHMGVGGAENDLWLDLLEWGQASRYAEWFDVNWTPPEPSLRGKVLVPFLGKTYAEALQTGGLVLKFDADRGEIAMWAGGAHKLPLSPRSYAGLLGDMVVDPPPVEALANPGEAADTLKRRLAGRGEIEGILEGANASPDRLHAIVEQQNWRPARYSVAADDINYRRFFIVSDLAAVRIEREDVFKHVHQVPLRLVEESLVDGLRVDHIDGLKDPKDYCLRLRRSSPRPVYIVVEKILAPHEQLRTDWGVDGTTGYEFATAVTQLITDPDAEAALTETYAREAGPQPEVIDIERRTKSDIIDYEMPAELDALTTRLRALAGQNRASADMTRNALRSALRAYVTALPVYRTYVDEGDLADADKRNIAVALAGARELAPELDPDVFDFLERIVLGELCHPTSGYDVGDVREVSYRIQQYTGPVMAKGLEDTALYRFNRLIALSDVGEKPDRFSRSIAAFHDFCVSRQKTFPNGLLTSSSHDTKRGEDVRARVTVLTGFAADWGCSVQRWNALLDGPAATGIERNDRYYFFQLLLGAWPTTFAPGTALPEHDLELFRQRLTDAMLKSVREARQRTNWAAPRDEYEQQISEFVSKALAQDNAFLGDFRRFERRIGSLGAQNSLIALILKLTVPGVPDIYQGAELWEQSMVDPDNRRAVDFDMRRKSLAEVALIDDGFPDWRSGRVKQATIKALLEFRSVSPDLFASGGYEPLNVDFVDDSILAFLRRYDDQVLIVCVRLYPWRPSAWERASLTLPEDVQVTDLRQVLGNVTASGHDARVSFDRMPFAVASARVLR